MIVNTNKHLYQPNVTEETLFKPSKGLVIPRYHSTPLTSKRGNFYSYLSQVSFEYDFSETNRIIDTESFVARIFKKKKDLILKEEPIIKADNKRNLKYVLKRMEDIEYASKLDLAGLLTAITESLVNYNNSFILTMREEGKKDGYNNTTKLPPIESVHVLSPLRLKPVLNTIGETLGYNYSPKQGNVQPIYIPAEYVYHIYADKKLDISVGTPLLEAVKDDILSLRQIEESMERLIYKNASPLLHAKIGTEMFPADMLPTGELEIDYYNRLISNMDDEGGLTTSHRVDIDLLGTESKALRFDGSMDYYKSRVLSGLNASLLDIGEAPPSLSSTGAELVSQVLKEDVISYQKLIERFFTNTLFNDLLLDSYWYSTKLKVPEEGRVTFKLPDPNVDSKIRQESHLANLVRYGLMDREQFSAETGYALPDIMATPEGIAQTISNTGAFSTKSTPQNQNTDAIDAEYQVLDELMVGDGETVYRNIYFYLVNNFEGLGDKKPIELIARELEKIVFRYKSLNYPVRLLSNIFNSSLESIIIDNIKDN